MRAPEAWVRWRFQEWLWRWRFQGWPRRWRFQEWSWRWRFLEWLRRWRFGCGRGGFGRGGGGRGGFCDKGPPSEHIGFFSSIMELKKRFNFFVICWVFNKQYLKPEKYPALLILFLATRFCLSEFPSTSCLLLCHSGLLLYCLYFSLWKNRKGYIDSLF